MRPATTCRLVALGLWALMVLEARPEESGLSAAPGRQVWLVSTRAAYRCVSPDGVDAIRFWHLQGDSQWGEADRAAFLAADDPALPTTVVIPGNRATAQDAIDMGWQVLGQLEAAAPGRTRLVVWAWPAERTSRRNRPDVQLKAARSDTESYWLAAILGRMHPQVPVNLVGYSFGARIITGACELLAGGQIACRRLDAEGPARRAPMRAMLVAGALDAHWLLPGYRNGRALSQLDRLLVTVNGCDPVLRFYPLMYGRGGPPAMGYVGLAAPACLGAEREKIELLGVSCEVGKNHAWDAYFCSAALRQRMLSYSFSETAGQLDR